MHFLLRNLQAAQGYKLELELEPGAEAEEQEDEEDAISLQDIWFPCNIHSDN